MPHPVRPPAYVFHQFPEMITLPDGSHVIAQDQKHKAEILEAATDPVSNVTELKRGSGRPKRIA